MLARLGKYLHSRRTGAHQIAHRFMGGVRNPNSSQLAGAVQSRQRRAFLWPSLLPTSRLRRDHRSVAGEIDASQFDRRFPTTFPRFVQYAIWRYCSQQGLDICNGNQIDDRKPCENVQCALYPACDRITLNKRKTLSLDSK
jgi:hypothetical protein